MSYEHQVPTLTDSQIVEALYNKTDLGQIQWKSYHEGQVFSWASEGIWFILRADFDPGGKATDVRLMIRYVRGRQVNLEIGGQSVKELFDRVYGEFAIKGQEAQCVQSNLRLSASVLLHDYVFLCQKM